MYISTRNSLKILLLLFLLPSLSYGATYYVDYDLGTDQTNCGQADGASACKTPWYSGLHSQLTSGGDTVIIHQIDNGDPYVNGGVTVIEADIDNVSWQAASGETPKISVTSTFGNCDSSVTQQDQQIVAFSADGAEVTGFYIWGQVIFGVHANNNLLHDNDISGGIRGWAGFISPIGFYSPDASCSTGRATGNQIYNNKIHDSCTNIPNSECPTSSNNDQCPLSMNYCDQDTVYENNDFYNSNAAGIRFKGAPKDVIVRKNFAHDLRDGYGLVQGSDGGSGGSGSYYIYQNVIVGSGTSSIAIMPKFITTGTWEIYNNTIYNANVLSYWVAWNTVNFFNNILWTTSANTDIAYSQDNLNAYGTTFTYSNYNDLYSSGSGSIRWRFADGTSSSLSAWITRNGDDNSTILTDPNFTNSSGNWNIATDFKRSSYPTNGRGGAYNDVMGAYLDDNTTIGYDAGGDTTPPTVISASVNDKDFSMNCSENVITTGYDSGDCHVVCTTAGDQAITSLSGSGSNRTATLGSSVGYGDSCVLNCTLGTGDITDTSANDMVTFSGTNVSVNTPSPASNGSITGGGSGSIANSGSGSMTTVAP